MAFGDTEDDAVLRQAWGTFCDELKAAGEWTMPYRS